MHHGLTSLLRSKPRTPPQLPLDLDWPRKTALGRSDFIEAACNRAALEMLDAWQHWPNRRLMLCGQEASGKTHLAAIWAAQADAQFINLSRVTEANVRDVAALDRIVIEDCDRALASVDNRTEMERSFHHLLNIVAERRGWMLLTGRIPPIRWKVDLPDLASRLRAVTVFDVKRPDCDVMAQLIVKLFDDRQVAVQPNVAGYIAVRLERSFRAVADAVDRLDRRSLQTKRPVTIALAKDEYGW